uniref:Uncharacterized protein n=1 Tax=Nymphaea colorata TaxID=210225 RepID=A0A5K0XTE5_9MAGN
MLKLENLILSSIIIIFAHGSMEMLQQHSTMAALALARALRSLLSAGGN